MCFLLTLHNILQIEHLGVLMFTGQYDTNKKTRRAKYSAVLTPFSSLHCKAKQARPWVGHSDDDLEHVPKVSDCHVMSLTFLPLATCARPRICPTSAAIVLSSLCHLLQFCLPFCVRFSFHLSARSSRCPAFRTPCSRSLLWKYPCLQ